MIDHNEMLIEFGYSTADTDQNYRCYKDIKMFHVDSAWWDGSYGKQFKNKPKPELNMLWRDVNKSAGSINNMELNAVISANSDDATDDGSELLQKRWRNDFAASGGAEANETANREAIVGGFGAVKLVAKYEDEENPDPQKQYLCIERIGSACTSVFFDSGAIKKDKSDAIRGWQLLRVNQRSTEIEYDVDEIVSFPSPLYDGQSTSLEYDSERDCFIAHYYELVKKNLTVHDFTNMLGFKITSGNGIKDEDGNRITKDQLKEYKEQYLEMFGDEVETYNQLDIYVEYALCDGEKYLTKPQRMPFNRIPIIPRYGYYSEVDGREYYCGEVRKRRDVEMFYNMYASTMVEIMGKPQVSKPEYLAEQIAAHANQRARADLDNVPFVLSDVAYTKDGQAVIGPIGQTQPPMVGTGLQAGGDFLMNSIAFNSSMGQVTVPANASAEAIKQINERTDDALLPIVRNVMHSIQAMCAAWIPAAQKLYFSSQRKIRVQEIDGKYNQVTTLEITKSPNGEIGPYGNNPLGKYTVTVKEGEAYKDTVSATVQENLELMAAVGTDTEAGQILAYKNMELLNKTDDPAIDAIAKYGRLDLIVQKGFPYEPQDEEEAQYIAIKQQQMQAAQMQAEAMMQQQQQQLIDSESEARIMEGQAAIMNEQNDAVKNQIDMEKMKTDRLKVVGGLQVEGVKLDQKEAEMNFKAANEMFNNRQQ